MLDIDGYRKKNSHTAIMFLAITAFCGFFSSVYGKYSHGVSSDYMVFMCVIPFLLGVVPYTLMWMLKLRSAEILFGHIYNCGVITLIFGSCLSGIFEIYGSVCNYVLVYYWVGTALIITGVLCHIINLFVINKTKA